MKFVSIFFSALLLLVICLNLNAQPGVLDLDFAGDGIFIHDFGYGDDYCQVLVIQDDQKIVAAGSSFNNKNSDFTLIRLNPDGEFDNSFGSNGIVITPVGDSNDILIDCKLQTDGKIVVAGRSYNALSGYDFALARYNSDGSLDNTFSSDGKLTTSIGNDNDFALGVAIQENGKIVVCGFTTEGEIEHIALIRYNSDGTLDNTFGTGGIVIKRFKLLNLTYTSCANDIEIQTDEKIVVGGYAYNMSNYSDFTLLRFNSNGSLDDSFNSSGIVTTQVSSMYDGIGQIKIQPDNKIICSGTSWTGSTYDMVLARYNSDGSIDSSFSYDGLVVTDISDKEGVNSVVMQPDGKYIAAGYLKINSINVSTFIRYNSDGSIDLNFGTNGISHPFSNNTNALTDVILQDNGRIVAGGNCNLGSYSDFIVMRLLSGLVLNVDDFTTDNSILVYPNPLNEQSNLTYTIDKTQELSLSLYDMHGLRVATYFENLRQQAGTYTQKLSLPENLSDGNYFLILSTKNKRATIKLIK